MTASVLVPTVMRGVQLRGHGGPELLEYRTDLPVPTPAPDEVLIEVGAAGVNNTDINTRIGWYSKSVEGATDPAQVATDDDGAWSDQPIQFPRIQGADCCGQIVAVGSAVDPGRIGSRVLVRSMQQARDGDTTVTFGSELDGAFAAYAVARSAETWTVESTWSDVELASIPCAWSTAETMLHRGDIGAERVLITGASGGVGAALVQLAKRRGAHVTAVAGGAKATMVTELGADVVVDRTTDLVDAFGESAFDGVLDVVAGPMFESLLRVLRRGGRYMTAGAIAGPLVQLDVRDLYLKDLSILGSTRQPRAVFDDLVRYIENDEIRPIVAATYPLDAIADAQARFVAKDFVGKIVLTL